LSSYNDLFLDNVKAKFEDENIRKDPKKLSELMTEMEARYKIPMFNDEKFNRKYPEVIELYRKISSARNL